MPTRLVQDHVRKLKTHELLDFHVAEMARSFNVSEQAMTIRLTSLGLL
jgi:Zn-dependent peptidase ImmA (M78 family)